jgi:catechol 2,3-dioxygenase-like lactoylglutathione lyase family enzyme
LTSGGAPLIISTLLETSEITVPANIAEIPMKRLHVHVSVTDLNASLRFYRELFAADPVVVKPDYAKWMLEDPRVNFAISQRGGASGIRHLGLQVEDRPELAEVYGRLKRAQGPVLEEGATTCCYAKSEKSWIADPQGVQWETFLTTGEATVYGNDPAPEKAAAASPCCIPLGR